MSKELFQYPKPCLSISKKEQRRFNKTGTCEVTYPVSVCYNGGIILCPDGKMDFHDTNPKSKWYQGYSVPSPSIPDSRGL